MHYRLKSAEDIEENGSCREGIDDRGRGAATTRIVASMMVDAPL